MKNAETNVITAAMYAAMSDDEKSTLAIEYMAQRANVAADASVTILSDVAKRAAAQAKLSRDALKAANALVAAAKKSMPKADGIGAIAVVRDVINASPRAVKQRLISLSRAVLSAESKMSDSTIRSIRSDHMNAARSFRRAGYFNEAGMAWLAEAIMNDDE